MCHPEIFHTSHQCHVKDSKSNAEFRYNLSAIHAKCSLTFESLSTTHLRLYQRMRQQTQNTCWLKILPLSMYTSSKHCWLLLKSFSSSFSNFRILYISGKKRVRLEPAQRDVLFHHFTEEHSKWVPIHYNLKHTNATKNIIGFLRVFLSYFYCLKLLKPTLARKC